MCKSPKENNGRVGSGARFIVWGSGVDGMAGKFDEVINGVRCGINPGGLESANAGIRRIRGKCCGLLDIDRLLGKMRRIAFQRGFPAISGFETAPKKEKNSILLLTLFQIMLI